VTSCTDNISRVGLTVLYKFCNKKNSQFTANNLTKGHKVFQSLSPLLPTSHRNRDSNCACALCTVSRRKTE